MLYHFSDKEKDYVQLKYETSNELEILEKSPFVYHNKMKTEFFVRFQYLVQLNKILTKLKPFVQEDRRILKSKFEFIKRMDRFVHLKKSDFNYSFYMSEKSEITPKEFQKIGADYITAVKRCILADDVGTGKTIQTILALCRLTALNKIKNKILIVTPASVKYQWKNEIEENVNMKFLSSFKELKVVEGVKKERQLVYQSDAKILIMNYEQFLHDFTELYMLVPKIDCIVCDEASYIKNPDAQRTKKINTLMRNVPFKILLTATPIENKLHDLYSLCQFLDPSIFINYKYFSEMYCNFYEFRLGRFGPMIRKLVKENPYKNLMDAKLKIRGFYLRRTISMVKEELPEFRVQLRLIDLMPEQRKLYDKIKESRDFENLTSQRHALMRVCNEPSQTDKTLIGKSAKTKELFSLLDNELSNEKVVIFCFYRQYMNVLFEQMKKKKYSPFYIHGGTSAQDRERQRQMFNKMESRRIILMTSAGERGVDLPAAGVLINLDLPENPSRLKQRCGRIRRLSSKHKFARIINILAKDTIEEKTIKMVFSKMNLFEEFFTEDNPDLISGGSFYKNMNEDQIKKLF